MVEEVAERRREKTILVVDDEPNVLLFISKTLRPLGYDTLTCSNGIEALKILGRCMEKISLVLLDLKMQGMAGLEVLKTIRKIQPDLPVIVLTALIHKRTECEELGVAAFISKPYSLEILHLSIQSAILRGNVENKVFVLDPENEICAKVLIVDDELEICELLGRTLAEDVHDAHFEVAWVTRGDEALRISTEFKPDIGIVDIRLPHMWGDEVVRRFKAGDGYCPKDFIIYTSIADPREVERAKQLGHRFLTKPTQIDNLVEVLKGICIQHNLVRKRGGHSKA